MREVHQSARARRSIVRRSSVLTRPLGTTVGDFLDKPLAEGGLALSRPLASLVLAVANASLIWLLPQRACGHPSAATVHG